MESIKEMVQKIDVINFQSKSEIILIDHSLKTFGIKLFSSDESKRKVLDDMSLTKGYLIKEKDGGWRIQNAYIGNGFPAIELSILANSYQDKVKRDVSVRIHLGKQILELVNTDSPIPYEKVDEYNKCFQ